MESKGYMYQRNPIFCFIKQNKKKVVNFAIAILFHTISISMARTNQEVVEPFISIIGLVEAVVLC